MKKYVNFLKEYIKFTDKPKPEIKYNNKIIDIDKTVKLLIENDIDLNDNMIYRGTQLGDDFVVHIPDSNRYSLNSYNYVNIIMSHSKEWEGYSERKIICSTEYEKTKGYGNAYYIFPLEKNATINICPTSDYFHSFEINTNIINHFINLLFNYNEDMTFDDKIFQQNELNNLDLSYDDFYKKAEQKLSKIRDKISNSSVYKRIFDLDINDFFEGKADIENYTIPFDIEDENCLQSIMKYMDPVKNGFKKMNYEEYKKLPDFDDLDNEIWLDCKVLYIKFDAMENIKEKMENMFRFDGTPFYKKNN